MTTDTQLLERIMLQAQQLSPDNRVRLIQQLAETLIPVVQQKEARYLKYGQFNVGRMSTEEDFEIAEWRPTDEEMNGS